MKYRVSFTHDKLNKGTFSFNVEAPNATEAEKLAKTERDKVFLKKYNWKKVSSVKI